MHDYDDFEADPRFENAAGLIDRAMLTITSLQILAEEQDGYFSDDDILDAAERFAIGNYDEDGCLLNTADRDFLIDAVYDWLETSEEVS